MRILRFVGDSVTDISTFLSGIAYNMRYSENPLIRQGLSHDNMSDKGEYRNVDSVKYR